MIDLIPIDEKLFCICGHFRAEHITDRPSGKRLYCREKSCFCREYKEQPTIEQMRELYREGLK